MTATDKKTSRQSNGLLPMMTRSSIADRHRKRRERTLLGINPTMRIKEQTLDTKKNAFDDSSSSVFTLEQQQHEQPQPTTMSSSSLFQVILAASVGAGLAEYLFGPRISGSSSSSNIATKPRLSATFPATFQPNGALALQPQPPYSMVRNRLRAGRILGAAGTTPLLFGTKHYMQHEGNQHAIVASAAAGAAMATITTPLHNMSRMPYTTLSSSSFPSSLALLMTKNAPRIYTREMTGAIVLFGVYESLIAGENASAPTVLGAGAISGALYRTVLTGSAAAALRSMPFYAVLFFGYETTLRL